MNEIIRAIEAEQMRNDLPNFSVGDNVKVYVKIKEGTRERVQMFEGTVIKKQNGGLRETFTVRRVAYGTGVERTFPMNSPIIDKMEVVRKGKVRRAKLYYLRD
ncbi:50S ribosomal protein L19, partial [Clostridium perfringens]